MTQIKSSESRQNEDAKEPKFGKEFRRKHFAFREGYVPLNHGSFGMAPKCVNEERVRLLDKFNECLDIFFKDTLFDMIEDTRKIVADELDGELDNTVFVQNATTGINTVLRSYPISKGDKIIYSNLTYGAIAKTIKFLENRYGIVPIKVQLSYPMTDDEIVKAYMDAVEQNGPVKMCVFDSVSSMPAWRLPWERLCHELRKRNVLSVVDGAHGIGLIPISLKKARPDFFVSNLHKWYYTPVECAVLYVDKEHHHHIHSLPVSHPYLDDDDNSLGKVAEERRLLDRFTYIGTSDKSSMLSVPEAKRFMRETCGGVDNIIKYREELALEGGKLAAKEFGTEIMDLAPLGQHSAMVNVRVPLDDVAPEDLPPCKAFLIEYTLRYLNTFVPMDTHNGQVWSRWSAQIYNDLDDFKFAIKAVKKAIEVYHKTPKDELLPGFRN